MSTPSDAASEPGSAAGAPGPASPAAPAAAAPARPGETIDRLLKNMVRLGASDLHLKVGSPPLLRVGGKIQTVKADPLGIDEVEPLMEPLLDGAQRARMRAGLDLDMACSVAGVGRFRVSVFRQRGVASAAIRRVRTEVPTFEELRLPVAPMERIAGYQKGLVLVCGVTGSGKSTTLAALIERINASRRCHILTIEDPIEYLYRDKKAFVNQREIGIDVADFPTALKHVVRQDPDVILIGEMRDRDTFEAGLQAAETGHLVFGTLHSSTAPATIGRILDLFPADRERQVRQSLRFNLRAIICQQILPGAKPEAPLVPALEVLLVHATAQKVIAEGEDKKLEAIIRAGREEGMVDMNGSLVYLVQRGLVTEETALAASHNPEQLKMNLRGIYLGDERKILG